MALTALLCDAGQRLWTIFYEPPWLYQSIVVDVHSAILCSHAKFPVFVLYKARTNRLVVTRSREEKGTKWGFGSSRTCIDFGQSLSFSNWVTGCDSHVCRSAEEEWEVDWLFLSSRNGTLWNKWESGLFVFLKLETNARESVWHGRNGLIYIILLLPRQSSKWMN